MHWGRLVWTSTPPLSGSEDTTPGSRVCVFVRALFGWVGRAGLPGALGCASTFLWPFCPSSLFRPWGLGLPVLGFFFFFSRFFAFLFPLSFSPPAPLLTPAFCASRPGCPWPWRPSFSPAPPPFVFPFPFPPCVSRPLVLRAPPLAGCGVLLFPATGAPGLCVARFAPPFHLFVAPPPVPCASVCWRALLPAAVLCACPWVSCCASLALSPLFGAALRFGGPVRSRCAVGSVCALSGARRSGVFLCAALFPPVFCGVVLRCAAWCVVYSAAARCACSPASCDVVLRCLWCAAVLCCAGAPVSWSCVALSSAVLLLLACLRFSPLAPPPWRARCALCCLVSPCCAALPSVVLRCRVAVFRAACGGVVSRLALLSAAPLCAVLFVPRSGLLLRAVPRPRSCRPSALFALWCAVWFCCALSCAVVCCVPGCCAPPHCSTLWCVVVCCAVLCRSFGVSACCVVPSGAVRSSGVLRFPALCFLVFPRALCCVCVAVVWCCVLFFAAVLRAVVVPGCLAVRPSSPLCAVLCCAVLMRLRCAVRVACAVSGARWCGALLCVVL